MDNVDGHVGDIGSLSRYLAAVYDDLRRIAASKVAREGKCFTIQATELVHEAYLRLLKNGEMPQWRNQNHFLAAAAEAMRRILVDRARLRQSRKRGGGKDREPLADVTMGRDVDALDLIALDESLAELAVQSPRHAEVVKLRFFAGLTLAEIADVVGRSESTIDNDWAFARTWLRMNLAGENANCSGD
jgi:RNA polymerase sigma factor (TIGR02999 family)